MVVLAQARDFVGNHHTYLTAGGVDDRRRSSVEGDLRAGHGSRQRAVRGDHQPRQCRGPHIRAVNHDVQAGRQGSELSGGSVRHGHYRGRNHHRGGHGQGDGQVGGSLIAPAIEIETVPWYVPAGNPAGFTVTVTLDDATVPGVVPVVGTTDNQAHRKWWWPPH